MSRKVTIRLLSTRSLSSVSQAMHGDFVSKFKQIMFGNNVDPIKNIFATKMNNFRGELTDVPAKTKALATHRHTTIRPLNIRAITFPVSVFKQDLEQEHTKRCSPSVDKIKAIIPLLSD